MDGDWANGQSLRDHSARAAAKTLARGGRPHMSFARLRECASDGSSLKPTQTVPKLMPSL